MLSTILVHYSTVAFLLIISSCSTRCTATATTAFLSHRPVVKQRIPISPNDQHHSRLVTRHVATDPTQITERQQQQQNKPKYGTRIVKPIDALSTSYHAIVQSAYLRHILLQTHEMSSLVYQILYNSTAVMDFLLSAKNDGKDKDIRPVSYPREATSDPFGYLAHQISSCEESKEDGGVIRWIDNPLFQQGNNDGTSKTSTIDHPLLTKDTIQQIFEKQPKGGDVLTVTSTRGVHLLRVKRCVVKCLQGGQNKIITNRSKVRSFLCHFALLGAAGFLSFLWWQFVV